MDARLIARLLAIGATVGGVALGLAAAAALD
jgi:hypothetical protein